VADDGTLWQVGIPYQMHKCGVSGWQEDSIGASRWIRPWEAHQAKGFWTSLFYASITFYWVLWLDSDKVILLTTTCSCLRRCNFFLVSLQGVIHWVAEPSPGVEPLKVEVRHYDKLFKSEVWSLHLFLYLSDSTVLELCLALAIITFICPWRLIYF